MRAIRTNAGLREALSGPRREGRTIGLVPTMGALHEGHLSLIRGARRECDVVVVSLFVNPPQFEPGADLERYPRDEERDAALAAAQGADLLFAPHLDQVYPDGFATSVEVSGPTEVLCGAPERRGAAHFRAVTTVVAKLLIVAAPDVAYFGQKDAQQAIVIERMVRDLDFGVRIAVLPTVREPDGLAVSSRNVYLEPADRERAAAMHRALQAVALAAEHGEGVAPALERGRRVLAEAGIQPEYLEARDPVDLSTVEAFDGRPVLVAVAAQVGAARLIDNIVIESAGPASGPAGG